MKGRVPQTMKPQAPKKKIIVPPLDWMTDDTEISVLLKYLNDDLKNASAKLQHTEARYLVDLYYNIQDFRKATASQWNSGTKGGEPMQLSAAIYTVMKRMEKLIAASLGIYADHQLDGRWMQSLFGTGPVLTAGFLAHIDLTKAPIASSIWRFGGLDPSKKWEKGKKRPWNPSLKQLWWRWADVQWKFHNNSKAFYGRLMAKRKDYETAKNEHLDYADQAKEALETKNITDKDLITCYESGKLPLGRIHLRAYRWTAKLFLSHYYEVGRTHRGLPVIVPWILGPGGHKDYIAPPNFPFIDTKVA